jgi:hypothetical protein
VRVGCREHGVCVRVDEWRWIDLSVCMRPTVQSKPLPRSLSPCPKSSHSSCAGGCPALLHTKTNTTHTVKLQLLRRCSCSIESVHVVCYIVMYSAVSADTPLQPFHGRAPCLALFLDDFLLAVRRRAQLTCHSFSTQPRVQQNKGHTMGVGMEFKCEPGPRAQKEMLPQVRRSKQSRETLKEEATSM